MEEYTEYKIVVCGPGGVGKSCLTNQLIAGLFTEEYDPTIEDSYRKQVNVDGEEGVLDILDTAGQEEYSSMLDEYLRKGQGFLCCYSVTSRDSFEEIEVFRKKMLRATERSSVPMMLVGNKIDLVEKRVVSTEEGQSLAQQMNAVFIEASAKNNINVEEAFFELVRAIRRDRDAKGYKLPTGAAPDAAMQNKINSKFSRWSNAVNKTKSAIKKWSSRWRKGGSKSPKPGDSGNFSHNSHANNTSPTQQTQQQQQPVTFNNNNNTNNNSNNMNNNTNQSGSGSYDAEKQQLFSQMEMHRQETERREAELRRQQQALEQQKLELERQRQQIHLTFNSTTPISASNSNSFDQLPGQRQSGGSNHVSTLGFVPMQRPPQKQSSGTDEAYGNFPKNLSDLEQPWFHGNLSSPEADQLLLQNPRTGTFLIRFSSQPGFFAVSFIGEDSSVQKALIQNDPERGYCFVEPDAAYFPTLSDLVLASDHVLRYPLPNQKFAQQQNADQMDNAYGSLAEVQRRVLEEEAGYH